MRAMTTSGQFSNLATEDEAKGRWCPQRQVRYVDGRPVYPTCVADACMFWRWRGMRDYKPGSPPDNWVHTGFCGLAGDPP